MNVLDLSVLLYVYFKNNIESKLKLSYFVDKLRFKK